LETLGDTGLLTDTPDENTLVISTSITDIAEFHQSMTGSHLRTAANDHLYRGGAIMEMIWRAGDGGEIVLAIRDGRTRQLNDPIGDRGDRFTDCRDTFQAWAVDLASFFGTAQ